jgi:hypothetical protein
VGGAPAFQETALAGTRSASPADEDVVVRAGEMGLGNFMKAVETCFEQHGFYGLSLFSFPDMSAQQIAEEVGVVRQETGLRLMPHPSMRQARAGDVRALGHALVKDDRPRGHVTLRLAQRPTDDEWSALDAVFLPPEENPVAL